MKRYVCPKDIYTYNHIIIHTHTYSSYVVGIVRAEGARVPGKPARKKGQGE